MISLMRYGAVLPHFLIFRGEIMEQRFMLWGNNDVEISYFPAIRRASKSAVIILPGGGYSKRAAHEGEGYAQLFNTFGMDAFVVHYRVSPNKFPLPLLDARRAVRFVRSRADELDISKDKILIMGSSAGGHLAALTSTYLNEIDGEGVDSIDNEEYIPNAQILCYPVISSDESISHQGSYMNLLGERYCERKEFSPELLVNSTTPKAFIWHTAADNVVNATNSYRYAEALTKNGIPHELHVFPYGGHGLGLSENEPYVSEWTALLRRWLTLNGFLR